MPSATAGDRVPVIQTHLFVTSAATIRRVGTEGSPTVHFFRDPDAPEGIGSERLVVTGVARLHGATHDVVPDRIEAGTFLCAAVATRGDLTLRRVVPGTLDAVIEKLRETGADVSAGADWLRVTMDRRARAVRLKTPPPLVGCITP